MSQPFLRLSLPTDLESLAGLETRAMHFPMGHRIREWLTDHPTMTPDRIAVAEVNGSIVAAAALVPEPFLYRGFPIDTGVWDAVATEETHRRQGLCRAVMSLLEEHHRPSLLLVEGATAVYRRLGYFPAFPNRGGCNSGGALVRVADLPPASAWNTRPAQPEDAPWLAALRLRVAQESLLAAAPSEAQWKHTLRGDRSVVGPGGTTLNRWQEIRVLVEPMGDDVGFFAHDPWNMGLLMEMEMLPGQNFRSAGIAVLHSLAAFSGAQELKVALPDDHPLFAAFPHILSRRDRGGSDWHARIPNLGAFLAAVRPALEAALMRSPLVGWTGEVVLLCGESEIVITGKAGSLFVPNPNREADVRLTAGAWIHLVFGQSSPAILMEEDRDVGGSDEGLALLSSLFPTSGLVSAKSI